MEIGTLIARLGLDTSEFDSKLDNSGSKMDKFKGALGLLAGGALGALAGGLLVAGKAAFDFSSELNEATNKAQAQLGLTAEEATALGDIAVDVFKNNFGGSLTEAAEAVSEVKLQLGNLVSDTDLQSITEGAFNLKDAFGIEMGESVNATKTLMENFGLTSTQALDFITKGMQNGLNSSGDFLDSIGEYSTQFSNGGATADQFFSLMESGLQGGVLGTDKAADSFKEFSLRIADGSESSAEALAGLGINSEELWASMASGDTTTAEVFENVIAGLNEIVDPVERNAIGVALLGTQYEDLGASAVLGLDLSRTSMEDMAGATQGLNVQYDSLGSVMEGLQRRAIASLQPIGDKMLELANVVMPYVVIAFDWLDKNLPIIMDNAGKVINTVVSFISSLFQGPLANTLSNSEGDFNRILASITSVMNSVWSVISSIITQVKSFWDQNGNDIMNKTSEIWNGIFGVVSSVLNLVWGTVSSVLNTVAGFIRDHGADIQAIFKTAFDNIFTIVDTIIKNVQSVINGVTALMRGDFDTFGKEMGNIATRSFDAIKNVISNNIELAKTIWNNNSDDIKKKANEVWDGIKNKINEVVDGIKSSISNGIGEAKNNFNSKIGEIIDFVEGLPNRFRRAGEAFVDNLKDGFMDRVNDFIDSVRKKIKQVTDLLPGSEPKDTSSPLYNLARRGRALVGNFQDGIDAATIDLPFVDTIAAQLSNLDFNTAASSSVSTQTNWNVNITSDRGVGNILSDLSLRQQIGG